MRKIMMVFLFMCVGAEAARVVELLDYTPAFYYSDEYNQYNARKKVIELAHSNCPVGCYPVIRGVEYMWNTTYEYSITYYRPYYDSSGNVFTTEYVHSANGVIMYMRHRTLEWRGWLSTFTRI